MTWCVPNSCSRYTWYSLKCKFRAPEATTTLMVAVDVPSMDLPTVSIRSCASFKTFRWSGPAVLVGGPAKEMKDRLARRVRVRERNIFYFFKKAKYKISIFFVFFQCIFSSIFFLIICFLPRSPCFYTTYLCCVHSCQPPLSLSSPLLNIHPHHAPPKISRSFFFNTFTTSIFCIKTQHFYHINILY